MGCPASQTRHRSCSLNFEISMLVLIFSPSFLKIYHLAPVCRHLTLTLSSELDHFNSLLTLIIVHECSYSHSTVDDIYFRLVDHPVVKTLSYSDNAKACMRSWILTRQKRYAFKCVSTSLYRLICSVLTFISSII